MLCYIYINMERVQRKCRMVKGQMSSNNRFQQNVSCTNCKPLKRVIFFKLMGVMQMGTSAIKRAESIGSSSTHVKRHRQSQGLFAICNTCATPGPALGNGGNVVNLLVDKSTSRSSGNFSKNSLGIFVKRLFCNFNVRKRYKCGANACRERWDIWFDDKSINSSSAKL